MINDLARRLAREMAMPVAKIEEVIRQVLIELAQPPKTSVYDPETETRPERVQDILRRWRHKR